MRILDKIVLFIVSIIMILASIVIMVIPFDIKGKLSIDNIMNFIYNLRGNFIISLIGLILLILTITFFISFIKSGKKKKKDKSYLVVSNDYGEVTIYEETVIGLINNVALGFEGITNIKTSVSFEEGKINIILAGQTVQEINIPQISEELQKSIKTEVESATGALVNKIDIEIINVSRKK